MYRGKLLLLLLLLLRPIVRCTSVGSTRTCTVRTAVTTVLRTVQYEYLPCYELEHK